MNNITLYDPESHEPPDDPLLLRVLHGEWGIHDAEAGTMTAEAFAQKHRQLVRAWGRMEAWLCVTVDGTDYLWDRESGAYDGWDRRIRT